MDRKLLAAGISGAALAAACAQNPPLAVAPTQPPAQQQAEPPGPPPVIPPLTLEGYKKLVANQIAGASTHLFNDPLPEMLKSVVVLEITIDRQGRLGRVAVRRSNGFRELENRAIDSVRRATPFAAPTWLARHGEGSVSFLETFLFRDDGRFQIRSLVAAR
jgi:protein TonB